MIHVHKDRNVERISWQPWIVRLTDADYNISQPEIVNPTAQASQIFGYDIFSDDAATRADDRGQPYDIVPALGFRSG